MKRQFFFLLLIVTDMQAQTVSGNLLVNGMIDTVHSAILGEDRVVWIGLPESLRDKKAAVHKLPVVYLLDGNNHFAAVNAMLQQLGANNANMIWPDMIVVAIMNTHRARDFTPYPSPFWIYGDPSPLENTGGGERFVAFMEKELMPHIDSLYPTAPHRVLIGHSLGGLAVTNVLIHHTRLFNDYIIIDPSMWYDNRRFLQSVAVQLQQPRFKGTGVYLGIANTLSAGMDTLQVRSDTSRNSLHTRAILQLKDALARCSPANGMRFSYAYYANDTHMSAPMITWYDGLRFLFNYYPLDPAIEGRWFDPSDTLTHPAAELEAHFRQVSAKIGYPTPPPENLVTLYINTFNEYHMPAKAQELLLLNAGNYPASINAQQAAADHYLKTGDTATAKIYQQRVHELEKKRR